MAAPEPGQFDEFRAPLYWISRSLIVERDVCRILDYRAQALEGVFGGTSALLV